MRDVPNGYGRTQVGGFLTLSAFLANVLGNHYGLLRRFLGFVNAKKVESIRIVK